METRTANPSHLTATAMRSTSLLSSRPRASASSPVVRTVIADAGDLDVVLDVRGAMTLLKLGRNAVYDGCARGEIPHRRIGKLLRFSRNGLLRWLAASNPLSGSTAHD